MKKSPDQSFEAAQGRIGFKDLTIMLTYRCNYRCRDCLIGDKLGSNKTISLEEAVRVVDDAAKLRTIRAIAFAGGEPFLAYKRMVEISEYTWLRYRCGFSISTNCSWAKTPDVARAKLAPLYGNGMRWMLASWDVFHAEFGKFEHVVNAIRAAQEIGIKVSLQNIITPDSFRNTDLKEELKGKVDIEAIEWVENSVVPVGLGATELKQEERTFLDEIPEGDCNVGDVLNIEVDGTVKPCCGAAFMESHLDMGNAFDESVFDIVSRASVDPVINSLISCRGPKGIVQELLKSGREDLIPTEFGSSCELCYKILSKKDAREVVLDRLSDATVDVIAERLRAQYSMSVNVDSATYKE